MSNDTQAVAESRSRRPLTQQLTLVHPHKRLDLISSAWKIAGRFAT